MILGILSLIVVYVISILGAYRYKQLAFFHKDGMFNNEYFKHKPDRGDIIDVFIPFINSTYAFMYLRGAWAKEGYKETNFFNK